jgi:hypothetical protein
MSARTCPHCHQDEHHLPECPEMFWPDGHPRGSNCGAADLAPPGPLQDPADYQFSNRGGISPIGIEFAAIFATIERRVEP